MQAEQPPADYSKAFAEALCQRIRHLKKLCWSLGGLSWAMDPCTAWTHRSCNEAAMPGSCLPFKAWTFLQMHLEMVIPSLNEMLMKYVSAEPCGRS